MKILYIEDSPVSIRAMQRIAQHLGCELVTASNAADGLKMARAGCDLILMDISLPDLDGLTLTRHMRDEYITVPIVAVTAHAVTGYREKCLSAGCTDYITKPYNVGDMLDVIKRNEMKFPGSHE